MAYDNVNVHVNGNQDYASTLQTYSTIVLKPHIEDNRNVLTPCMMHKKNVKYVIKWDFILGDDITMPSGCLIEFDGGSIRNDVGNEYTMEGNESILIYHQELEDIIKDVELTGTWIHKAGGGIEDREPENGMGYITLRKDLGFAEQLTQENTIYVINYDYDLNDPNGENPVTIPEGCVLKFEGGSLSNGTIVGQNTIIDAGLTQIFDTNTILTGIWSNSEFNIEWFGIFPNAGEDASQAINAVIENFLDNKIIKFNHGIYYANIEIFRSNITISGNGAGNTIIKTPNGSNKNVFDIGNHADFTDWDSITQKENININNIEIDGNASNVPECSVDVLGHGIIMTWVTKSNFHDLYIHDCRMTGIDVVIWSNYNTISNIRLENNYSDMTYPAFDMNGDSLYNTVSNIIIDGCQRGFRILGCSYNSVSNLIIHNADFSGLTLISGSANNCKCNHVDAILKDCKYGFSIADDEDAREGIVCQGNVVTISAEGCNNNENSTKAFSIGGSNNIISITSQKNYGELLECLGVDNTINILSTEDNYEGSYSSYKWALTTTETSQSNKIYAKINTTLLHFLIARGENNYIELNAIDTEHSGNEIVSQSNTNTIKLVGVSEYGTERPQRKVINQMFYDTNLNTYIRWNGSEWVDSTGAIVL